jgi:hypothetical protein
MLDWSYDLLPEPERVLLHRLAIFAGPFSLEAASTVAASPELAVSEVIEGLSSLVAKSLVEAELKADMRYWLLDTTRAYALEKLDESGERQRITRRHAEFYEDLFERADAERDAPPPAEWLGKYGWCIGNLRAALDWAFSVEGDASIGVELVTWAAPLFIGLSLLDECGRWCERALACLDAAARGSRQEMILQEAFALSLMFTKGTNDRVHAVIERALVLEEAFGDRRHRLELLFGLFRLHMRLADFCRAHEVAQQSATFVETSKDPADLSSWARSPTACASTDKWRRPSLQSIRPSAALQIADRHLIWPNC